MISPRTALQQPCPCRRRTIAAAYPVEQVLAQSLYLPARLLRHLRRVVRLLLDLTERRGGGALRSLLSLTVGVVGVMVVGGVSAFAVIAPIKLLVTMMVMWGGTLRGEQ